MLPRAFSLASLATATLLLQGCIAAAVAIPPLAASALIGREVIQQSQRKRTKAEIAEAKAVLPAGAVLTDLTTLPPPSAAPAPVSDDGSAIAMASALTAKLERAKSDTKETPATRSVVLMPGATLAKPSFTICETLPPALVVDLDTARGAQVPSSDALADAFDSVRAQGIKVLFMSAAAEQFGSVLETDLLVSGLGPAKRGETLFLAGDRGSQDKQTLMWKLASNHCIIGIAGGDQSDFMPGLGNVPDGLAAQSVQSLNGNGWFLLSQLQARMGQ